MVSQIKLISQRLWEENSWRKPNNINGNTRINSKLSKDKKISNDERLKGLIIYINETLLQVNKVAETINDYKNVGILF